ncbi:MAG: c-type cytochrome [Chloroflexi bacterium]|nr:c-type cytochrome [Chloroflexota bacterium]
MFRWRSGLAILIGLVVLVTFMAQPVRADDPPGAKLYATYCAACHGAVGQGGFATAIGSAEYLNTHDDDAIIQAIGEGISAQGMPAWSKAKGGSLSDDQIADIVAYLRSLAGSEGGTSAPTATPSPTTSLPTAIAASQSTANGAATSGATLPAAQPTATPSPTATRVWVQTQLTVAQSTSAEGDTVLTATLKDDAGHPVQGVAIAFSRAALFGVVDLGTVKTDASGMAALVLPVAPSNGAPLVAAQVIVAFKGEKGWNASEAKIVLEPREVAASSADYNARRVYLSLDEPLLPPEGSLITPNPPLLPTVILALVVGGVWATYGYVMYQVFGIWKRGRTAPRKSVLRISGSERN